MLIVILSDVFYLNEIIINSMEPSGPRWYTHDREVRTQGLRPGLYPWILFGPNGIHDLGPKTGFPIRLQDLNTGTRYLLLAFMSLTSSKLLLLE